MADGLVQCPRCMGAGWLPFKDEDSYVQRKLKCELCDSAGMAHVQDIIDYYTHMSEKAPESDKVVRWESYLKLIDTQRLITAKGSPETER
jgi:hypothetical protein